MLLLLTQRDFHDLMAVSRGSWHALQLACAAEHVLRSPLVVGGERCHVRAPRLLLVGSALGPVAELRGPPWAKQNASPPPHHLTQNIYHACDTNFLAKGATSARKPNSWPLPRLGKPA